MAGGPRQLSLSVSLHDEATFANFWLPTGGSNRQAVASLSAQLDADGEAAIYLWGLPGTGLTHLLQAACHRAAALGCSAQYLPLAELVGFAPDALFEGLEHQDLICFDGLDVVAGRYDWEEALFGLINRVRDRGGHLAFAARRAARDLPLQVEDLRSRLNWAVRYHIAALDDSGKQRALQMRARARGMEMSEEVAQYILSRAPRDTKELFVLLNRLDQRSLQEQRRLTVPFVRKVLGSREEHPPFRQESFI